MGGASENGAGVGALAAAPNIFDGMAVGTVTGAGVGAAAGAGAGLGVAGFRKKPDTLPAPLDVAVGATTATGSDALVFAKENVEAAGAGTAGPDATGAVTFACSAG